MASSRKREASSSVDALRDELNGDGSSSSDAPRPVASVTGAQVIKWEIDGIRTLNETGNNSPMIRINGLDWYLRVRTECSERTNQVNQFSVYVYCDEKNPSEVWYADVSSNIRLINRNNKALDLNEKFTYRFMNGQTNSGYASLIAFDKLIRPGEGYIDRDKIKLEATVAVIRVRGLRTETALNDFTSPIANMTDGVLIVDGQRLHISKQFLALHSPFFEGMFYRGFREQHLDEIPLEDVEYEEFLELLHVLYPSEKAVSAATCPNLLKLADRFQMKAVLRRVEQYLSKTDDMQITTRLRYADQYNLFDAQNACLQQLKTLADITTLKNQRDYIMLGDAIRLMISEKQCKLLAKA